jgi:hypothetical protein
MGRETNLRLRASNELLMNEIVKLVFPDDRKNQSTEELALRLFMVAGVLSRNGFGPQPEAKSRRLAG